VADVPNETDPQLPSAEPGEKTQFFATQTGRWVIIGVALVVVAGIAGFVLLTVMNSGFFGQSAPVVQQTVPIGSLAASSSAAATTAAPITNPQSRPLESSFTFRNVFAPTLKEPTDLPTNTTGSSTSSSSSSTTDADSIDVPADTLYLVSIQTSNGEKTATFIWNNQSYTAAEGGTLAGTPWQVLEINDESVVMLYGDTEVTLTVGQGLSK
jgi:hypothetical protein